MDWINDALALRFVTTLALAAKKRGFDRTKAL